MPLEPSWAHEDADVKVAARPPLRRLLALDALIRSGRYPNARTAARALEVHPRTVHRDLEFLRDSWRAPLEYDPVRHGFYYTDPGFPPPLVRLTEGELVALFLAERLLQQYGGTPFAAELAAAFAKLTAALPDGVTVRLDHLQAAFSVRPLPADARATAALLGRLAAAVRGGRRLELVYASAASGRTASRRVDPYHLTAVGGDWYLVAFDHARAEVRMFAPGRIKELRETGEVFTRPADFTIEGYLGDSFRTFRGAGRPRVVRLRFAGPAARYVREKVWHPSQRVRELRGGGVELTLRVGHLLEVKRWALSWGADCEVLRPEGLRREVRVELGKAAGNYLRGGDAAGRPRARHGHR
jgi:predicted DNA-binding transcriptional regulator YafY